MKIKKELLLREIAGDYVLIPIGRTVLNTNGLYILTEVSARIFQLLPSVENETELIDRLMTEYDVERDVLAADVMSFLEELRGMEII